MIKKMFLTIFFLLVGCSENGTEKISNLESWLKDNGKIKVLSTTGMIGDLVSQVGQERVDLLNLIEGEIDPHTYELVKGDDEKFEFAQIVFSNGLGLEHGASLRRRLETHPRVISIGKEIERRSENAVIRKEGQIDPHIWLDVSLMKTAVEPIVEALSSLDPEHAEEYRQRGIVLQSTMEAVDRKIFELMQQIPEEKRYLVTSHDAFSYFSRRYLGECRCIAPEGLAPEGQLSVSDIQEVIRKIEAHHIPVLFPESNVSKDSLKKIASACKEKGMDVKIALHPLYADAMGSRSYLEMMLYNADVIWEALNGS